jgi:pSer/pThr/pTyr-binding forkhead associated (FHA) protein
MPMVYKLQVEGDGSTPHAVSLGARPFAIGRGPTNDLVVPDGQVSWEHARVWSDGQKVWLADLSSTNGTFVDGARVQGTISLGAGHLISVGSRVRLRVQVHGTRVDPGEGNRTVALENLRTGLQHPFRTSRFTVGSSLDADLRIEGLPPFAAQFAVHGPDDLWVVTEADDRPIQVGEVFELGAARFRLVEVDIPHAPTIQPERDRFPYRLTATLDGPTGPVADLADLLGPSQVRVDAETRAILLYLLGKRTHDDLQSGLPRDEAGWCADDDVIVGVWGRTGLADGANRLKVLVHRLRAEVERGGFDPWFIERRRRYIRIRIREFVDG